MIKISIVQYDAMLQSMIENLNLKKFDHDISYDQLQSIDMNFNVVENNNEFTHIIIDNIECLYDALNDVIETIRVHRYCELKYNRLMTITTNDNDNEFIVNDVIYHHRYNEYVEREIVTIEQIDEFEKTNNL